MTTNINLIDEGLDEMSSSIRGIVSKVKAARQRDALTPRSEKVMLNLPLASGAF